MRVFFLHNSQKTKKHYIPLDNIMLDDTVIKINRLRKKQKSLKIQNIKACNSEVYGAKKCVKLG